MGAFNKAYNDARKPTSLAAPADFGKAVPPKDRASAQDMFYRQEKMQAAGGAGFWGNLFKYMEKAYNLSAQAVSFGLLVGEETNPLYQGKGLDVNKIRQSWEKARTVSPGRALVKTLTGQPINLVEDALNAATLGKSRNKAEKFIKDHLLQLLTYMKLKNAKEGFFLYENKNTQEIIVIPVSMNEKNTEIIEEAFTWMCEVWDNFKEGDLPMRPAGASKSKMPCTYCPIKKECYAGLIGTVQIESYKVPKL